MQQSPELEGLCLRGRHPQPSGPTPDALPIQLWTLGPKTSKNQDKSLQSRQKHKKSRVGRGPIKDEYKRGGKRDRKVKLRGEWR